MIANRIKRIMRLNNLNASDFADKVNVQRSGLSHIFSGRNKPSLDLILKIVETFPDVNLEWLLKGKGDYKKGELNLEGDDDNSNKAESYTGNFAKIQKNDKGYNGKRKRGDVKEELSGNVTDVPENTKKVEQPDISEQGKEDNISLVLFFYEDGTFRHFKSRD